MALSETDKQFLLSAPLGKPSYISSWNMPELGAGEFNQFYQAHRILGGLFLILDYQITRKDENNPTGRSVEFSTREVIEPVQYDLERTERGALLHVAFNQRVQQLRDWQVRRINAALLQQQSKDTKLVLGIR